MDSKTISDPLGAVVQGAVLAAIVRIDRQGAPWVRVGGRKPVAARCLSTVTRATLSAALAERRTALVMLENGEPSLPIVIGVIGASEATTSAAPPAVAKVDGKRVVLHGTEEVSLSCGQASITLTKEGKIVLRGAYVSSASTGMNRITGGSVQIN